MREKQLKSAKCNDWSLSRELLNSSFLFLFLILFFVNTVKVTGQINFVFLYREDEKLQ